ncbi:hypothetical protein [Enterovirga aerilata]|uniref:hypothetical protein n=1 Tax=Enterovirga aerilata TaxID=2730920 RepID=UPI001FEE53F5|nr:hypothetical protein [Enterovirga sp. DB1703]
MPRRKGHHEGIVSGETFARIQERLAAGARAPIRKELKDLAAQTEKLLERIVETDNPAVVSAYEKKVSALESQRIILTEQADNAGKPRYAFDDVFELAMRFLANP